MTGKSAIAPIAALFVLCLASGADAATRFKTIYSFPDATAAANPWGGLARDAKGNLYGTTLNGGETNMTNCVTGCGVVYQLVPPKTGSEWTRRILHRFTPTEASGSYSNVVFAPDGSLIGATGGGGANGVGIIFRLIPPGNTADRAASWTFQTLFSFGGDAGDSPYGDLMVDSKGAVYGITNSGGANGYGTVFKLTPRSKLPWKITVLHTFTGDDGSFGEGGLVMDAKGILYGVTSMGGPKDDGVLFSLTPPQTGSDWTYKVLHTFRGGANDGATPFGSLVLKDGALYGTTSAGGANGDGTIYRLTLPKTFELIWSFTAAIDGKFPYTGLTLGANGVLFGLAYDKGSENQGTLFSIQPHLDGWSLGVPHKFAGAPDGDDPTGTLIVDEKGVLYGVTNYGGENDHGMVFMFKP